MQRSKPDVARSLTGSNAGRGISLSAAAGIASMIAGIILLPLVITTVGAGAYGIWLFLLAIATFLFHLDLGMGTAVVHFLSRARSGDRSISASQIGSTAHAWAILPALVALAVFAGVALVYLPGSAVSELLNPGEQLGLGLCGVALIVSVLARPLGSVLIGAGYLHLERRHQIVGVIIRVAGTVAACLLSTSVLWVAVAETAALIAPTACSAYVVFSRRLLLLRPSLVSILVLRRMLRYSLGSFSVSVIGAAVLQAGTVIIGIAGPPSAVTYFNAAFRLYSSVRQIISWLTDPFRTVLSRLYVQQQERAGTVLYDLLFVTLTASCVGGLSLIITAPALVEIWLGGEVPVDQVAFTTSILLVGLLLNAVHIPLIPAADAAGRPGVFLPHQTIWLASYAVLSLVLYPVWGIVGVAVALTAPLAVLEVAYLLRAKGILSLQLGRWYSKVLRPVIPILIAGGGLAGLSSAFSFGALGQCAAAGLFVIFSGAFLYLTRNSWSYRSVLSSLRAES